MIRKCLEGKSEVSNFLLYNSVFSELCTLLLLQSGDRGLLLLERLFAKTPSRRSDIQQSFRGIFFLTIIFVFQRVMCKP
jgi:hypothetical protein